MGSESFIVKLAGLPIGIRCKGSFSTVFFKDYVTDEEPLFTVEPTEDDVKRVYENSVLTAEKEGRDPSVIGYWTAESGAIHEMIANRLSNYGVLLMHGSCIAMDGEGYLFTAPSGTGKSTHTRLWREVFGDRCFYVNDDKPFLRIDENGVTAFGSPWNGKHRLDSNVSVPLKAIVSLGRGETNSIRPMSKAEAFALLIRQVYSSKDAEVMSRILELEKKLLERVSFYSLSCNMDPEAALVAYQGMNQ